MSSALVGTHLDDVTGAAGAPVSVAAVDPLLATVSFATTMRVTVQPPLPCGGEGWGEGALTDCAGLPSPPTPLPKGEGAQWLPVRERAIGHLSTGKPLALARLPALGPAVDDPVPDRRQHRGPGGIAAVWISSRRLFDHRDRLRLDRLGRRREG